MPDKNSDSFVDELLDGALARYSRVEPRPGLEERVLEHLRAQPRIVGWLQGLRVPLAATAGVVLILATVFFVSQRAPKSASAPAVTRVRPTEAPAPPPPVARPEPALRVAPPPMLLPRHGGAAAVAFAPRLPQFPRPAPLSEQERLLLRFVAEAPQQVLWARAAAQPFEELQVARLGAAPLVVPELLPVSAENKI